MAYTTIDKPDLYFNTVLYTGTGSENAITGVNFQPDMTWLKRRDGIGSHRVYDAVRGATKEIYTDATLAEYTEVQSLKSFDSDGFTMGTDAATNGSTKTYVAWNLKANGSGSSNTDGSITSTVSANTTSGFSIVSYTGTGSVGTVGHGLGATPKMIIARSRSNGGAGWHWRVYHASIGATKYLGLNETIAATTSSTFWNDTEPTSSVFTLGTDGLVNLSSGTFIAYCFAEKKGFSKFGGYTGNGNADGTFIYTGFKPAFVIIKASGFSGTDWQMYDNKRNTYNSTNNYLRPNLSNAEATGDDIDFLSNGFKIRTSSGWINNNTYENIYMCFAESPFTTSTAIPCTAR